MKIVYQGSPGAYSHLAAEKIYPKKEYISCNTFEECFKHCHENEDFNTIIPVENSIAGRVADTQYLINKYKLQIYAEHFQEIKHNLMILKENDLKNIKSVRSHSQAISQCQKLINIHKFETIIAADTAGSAKFISEKKIKNEAAIASELAAKIYDLKIVKKNIEDNLSNVTRFLIMGKKKSHPEFKNKNYQIYDYAGPKEYAYQLVERARTYKDLFKYEKSIQDYEKYLTIVSVVNLNELASNDYLKALSEIEFIHSNIFSPLWNEVIITVISWLFISALNKW